METTNDRQERQRTVAGKLADIDHYVRIERGALSIFDQFGARVASGLDIEAAEEATMALRQRDID